MNDLSFNGLDLSELDVQKQEILLLLKRTGLSDYEAKAYLALVMRSHGTADDVAEIAKVPRTSTYKVLDALKRKGFVTATGGRPVVYHPVPPEEVKERLTADLDRTFRHLEALKGTLSERGTSQLIYTITGKEKILVKIGEMLDRAKERFFLSSPVLSDINSVLGGKFSNAMKRGVRITVVAEPTLRVPEATEVVRKQDLLAIDVVTDDEIALIASPDLSICGFTDNPFLVAYLDNFFQMSLEKDAAGKGAPAPSRPT